MLYSSALLLMWILTMVNFTGGWLAARTQFIANNTGSTPFTILTYNPQPISVIIEISAILVAGISDASIVRLFISTIVILSNFHSPL